MAKKRVAINGFGRIGRLFFRIAMEDPNIEIVAINDISDIKAGAHLLKYDSTYGRSKFDVKNDDKNLIINGKSIPFLAERDPTKLPWAAMNVDIVYESTGVFTKRDDFQKHITAGAKKVFISAPAEGVDATIVYGVNNDMLKADMKFISGGSCTTNCLAPVCKVLMDNWGIKSGLMTTVHAYTNDQKVLDIVHKDLRRARSAAVNIIPTSTGAAKAIGEVIPALKGKMDGIALRVPVVDGSIVDLKVQLEKPAKKDEINAAMKAASEGALKDVLGYTSDPIVSTDVIGIKNGSLFDSEFTKVLGDTFGSLMSWYDNEASFTIQSVRVISKLM